MSEGSTSWVEMEAANPKSGFTLDELERLVIKARDRGIDGSSKVTITANWKSGFKRARIEGTIITSKAPRKWELDT